MEHANRGRVSGASHGGAADRAGRGELFERVVERALGRRAFLRGGLGVGAVAFLSGSPLACGSASRRERDDRAQPVGFGVAASSGHRVHVPAGYEVDVLMPWGSALFPDSSAWRDDGTCSGEDQARQIGDNHDGMHFFPIDGRSSREGLLVVNHEYTNYEYLFGAEFMTPWTADKVRKAQNAHGVSVVHVRRSDAGRWEVVLDSPYNRRITARTETKLSGPAAGDPLLRTRVDPTGTAVLGTLNNCANGHTPWGTYLTCEENFHVYFGASGGKDARSQGMKRYGIPADASRAGWEAHDVRFDHGAEPNECNRFGWVMEIDPFEPSSTPIKRTALGRFRHENAALTLARDGRVVVYMGDDARFEYLYKFVSEGRYAEDDPASNQNLLDRGKLYVARFDAGDTPDDALGVGQWLLLDKTANPVLARDPDFASQAEVLIHARLAADRVGATPMDRPEWVAVHPARREVYCTLTNNSERGEDRIDAANPRARNVYGQIVRWREAGGDAAAERFEWDLFVLAGNPRAYPDRADPRSGSANVTLDNTFNSPDGLAIDPAGRLWIQTDGGVSSEGDYRGQGNNQMLCADPATGRIDRFLVGPSGCEITGITWTPDGTTLFVNVQHPGSAAGHPSAPDWTGSESLEAHLAERPTSFSVWPESQFPDQVEGGGRPRSATVVITRADGGVVGT